MKRITIFLFIFSLILSALIYAQDLNNTQKRNLKNATTNVEKAEKSKDANSIEMYLRSAKRDLELLKDVANNEEVKALQARYNVQEVRAKCERVLAELKSSKDGVAGKMKRNPNIAKMPKYDKTYMVSQLEKMDGLLATLKATENKDYEEIIKQTEDFIATARDFLGSENKPEPTKPEPTKPEPTKPEPTKPEPTKPEPTKPEPTKVDQTKPTPEEKNAQARLKSIFSFSKNYMADGKKYQAMIEEGQNISVGRFHDVTIKLEKLVQDAEPHIKVISQYPERNAEALKTFQEIQELSQYLNKLLKECQAKELDAAAKESLKYFEEYLANAEKVLAEYAKRIEASNNPENEVRYIITEGLEFNIRKAEEQLVGAQRQYSTHPYTIEATKKLEIVQKKAQEARTQIASLGTVQRAKIYWNNVQLHLKNSKKESDRNQLNPSLIQAANAYLEMITYLKQHQDIEDLQKVLPKIEKGLQECKKSQINDSLEVTLQAIEQKRFGWLENLSNQVKTIAGDNKELLDMLAENEVKIFHAACKKAVELEKESVDKDLEGWNSLYWKKILIFAQKPDFLKIVEKYAAPMITEQLDLALKILEKSDMAPDLQLQEFDKYYKNAQLLIAGNPELAKLIKPYEAKFETLKIQATERYQKKLQEIALAEQAAKEQFEKTLSPAQSTVYTEWGKKYPDKKQESNGEIQWVYIEKETDFEIDTHHTYLFDKAGKLVGKESKLVGGGKVYGYANETTWTKIAEVKKNGSISGYQNETTWTKILEVKSNGEVYGYRDGSIWTQIGEIRSNGQVYGYSSGSTWSQIAEVKSNGEVFGYASSSTWARIAEIKPNGVIYGYSSPNYWSKIAETTIPNPNYRLAVLLFVIYGHR